MRSIFCALLLTSLFAASPAHAADKPVSCTKDTDCKSGLTCIDKTCQTPPPKGDDDLLGDDDGTIGPKTTTKPPPAGTPPAKPPPADEDPNLDSTTGAAKAGKGDGDILGGEIDKDTIGGVGQDNADIFRAYQNSLKDYGPDEELIAWDKYLQTYPKTLFKQKISERVDALNEILYASKVQNPNDTGPRLDADKREILLAQGLDIENMNPRSRLQFGFEWGLPNFINLNVDFEHQFIRTLSAHVGLRHAYTGWRIGLGGKWAFIKDSRTQTIMSFLGDVELNATPASLVLRPQLAFGKKFGKLDAQIQAGAEVDTRSLAGVRAIGGLNLTYRAADRVSLFAEGTVYMQSLSSEKGNMFYRFDTVDFGLKFMPALPNKKVMEVNLGAAIPASENYWAYHYGAIIGQGNYYL